MWFSHLNICAKDLIYGIKPERVCFLFFSPPLPFLFFEYAFWLSMEKFKKIIHEFHTFMFGNFVVTLEPRQPTARLAKRKEDEALEALDAKMKAMAEKGDATLQKTMAR